MPQGKKHHGHSYLPLWVACSNRDTIRLAARLGLGVLTFAFIDVTEAKKWVDDDYTILKHECTPIGHAINPNVAMVTSFSCHEDETQARADAAQAIHAGAGRRRDPDD